MGGEKGTSGSLDHRAGRIQRISWTRVLQGLKATFRESEEMKDIMNYGRHNVQFQTIPSKNRADRDIVHILV